MFLSVEYSLKAIPETKVDNRIFFKGFNWFDPEELSFKKQIKNLYNNYEHHLGISKKLSKETINNFSKKAIKEKYEKLIFGNCND